MTSLTLTVLPTTDGYAVRWQSGSVVGFVQIKASDYVTSPCIAAALVAMRFREGGDDDPPPRAILPAWSHRCGSGACAEFLDGVAYLP